MRHFNVNCVVKKLIDIDEIDGDLENYENFYERNFRYLVNDKMSSLLTIPKCFCLFFAMKKLHTSEALTTHFSIDLT